MIAWRARSLSVALLLPAPALAAPPAPARPVEKLEVPADVSAEMRVVTDGKGHYLAFPSRPKLHDWLFYGDGKHFWQQRGTSGGAQGDTQWYQAFWEPRVPIADGVASFEFRDGKFSVSCGKRKAELTLVPPADAKAMLAAAQLHPVRWKHRAHLLARDEAGRYFYVDREREPPDSKAYRLFMGPKGNLKLQKMTNVVADSQGDIFATKTGSLRLIAGKDDYLWVAAEKKTKLTNVPIDLNAPMIYSELGVYAGEPLGTPCDDL
jgi:hypothetical protein